MTVFLTGFAMLETPTKNFTINALGEVFIGNDCVAGSIQVSDNPDEGEIARRFRRQMVEADLTGAEIALVEHIWQLQGVNDSRARLWFSNGLMRLDTEFASFVDNTALWDKVEAAAQALSATIEVLFEGDHLNCYSPVAGIAHSQNDRPDPDRPGWFFGENHGRPERQVAIQCTLPANASREDVAKTIEKMTAATQEIWDSDGVGVI